MYSITAWSFPIWYSLVLFWGNRCLFLPSLSPISVVTLFIHSTFSLFFGCHILVQNRWISFVSVCMFYCHLHPIVDRIFFHLFGMSYFVYIILPSVDISLIFLLSPVLSDLFPQVVLLAFPVFLFFSVPNYSIVFLISLSFWPIFVDFNCVSIPILDLIFISWFLRGSLFSRKLISLLISSFNSVILCVDIYVSTLLYSSLS